MAKQLLNRGTTANDGTGDNIRIGAGKINDNFDEIYNAIGDGSIISAGNFLTDISVDTLQNKTISGLNNTLSGIGNGSLTNSTVSYGGVGLSLGGSDATPAFDLTDATNYPTSSLVGNVQNSQLQNSGFIVVDDTSTATTISLGETFRITGGTAVTTAMTGDHLDITIGSIENSQLINPRFTLSDDSSTTTNIELGETLTVLGGAGIDTTLSGDTLTVTANNVTTSEISPSASIANTQLANYQITFGADTLALGDTTSTITDLNLDGTSSLSGTGTIDQTGSGSKVRGNFANLAGLPTSATYTGAFTLTEDDSIPRVASSGGYIELLTENSSVSKHADVSIAGISNNDILQWSSAQGRFNAVTPPLGVAQQFRLTGNVTSTGSSSFADLTGTWEEPDNALYNSQGSTLTESSGVFTLPETGLYLITFDMQWSGASGDFVRTQLMVTDNNSTYTEAALSEDSVSAGGYANNNGSFMFNCGDTANEKFKFQHSGSGTSALLGNTDYNRSHFTILKIA